MGEGRKKNPPGNPPWPFDEELGKEICEKVACNTTSLRSLCKKNPHWPSDETIYKWRRENEKFAGMYAKAKAEQIEALVDETLEICNDSSEDYIVDDDGKLQFNKEHVMRSRLKVDTRKWLASKLVPRLYGDKLTDTPQGEALMLKLLGKL